ncbi:MAG: glycosyltransferase family 2 protein [Candidatus Omnitrophota bacterium]
MKSISIIILTWNGRELLAKYLPSAIKEYGAYKGEKELIIVDNGSDDGTAGFLEKEFPQTKVIKLPENKGFPAGSNRGFRESKNDIVILLNNDVLLAENFLVNLVDGFKQNDIFAVRAGLVSENESELDLSGFFLGLSLKRGMIETPMFLSNKRPHPSIVSCAGGAAVAYEREKLNALGGFDEIFSPFYWEDIDLSYRALKRGWKILSEPEARCYHRRHATIGRYFSRRYPQMISERNRYLLFWKNISDLGMWLRHILWIPPRLMIFLFTLKWHKIAAFILAIRKIKEVIIKRKASVSSFARKDSDIFREFRPMQKNARPLIDKSAR